MMILDRIEFIKKQLECDEQTNNDENREEEIRDKLNRLWILKKKIRESALKIDPLSKFSDEQNVKMYDVIATKRHVLIDIYMHERFLLKAVDGMAVSNLRAELVSVAAELGGIRDVGRVASVVFADKCAAEDEKEITSLRKTEWSLMEREKKLNEKICFIDKNGRNEIQKIQNQIDEFGGRISIESNFVNEKLLFVKSIKQEITTVRNGVKSIENSVSKFRAYLREDAKIRRTDAIKLRP